VSRLQDLAREELSAEQRALYDRVASGPRGGVRGLYQAWLRSPQYCDRIEQTARYLRFECSVPHRLRELAILMVARHWRARHMWHAHAPIAAGQGVAPEVIAAIGAGRTPDLTRSDEAIVYTYVNEMQTTHAIGDQNYRRTLDLLGEVALVELAALVGHYTSVAITLKTFAIETPADAEVPF